MKRVVIASAVLTMLAFVNEANAAGPTLHSNGSPPAPRNPSAATGRSGSATLAARALEGKDGKVEVDVTTGALDSATAAPGTITKVQFKTFQNDAEDFWTKNYSGLTAGGSLQYAFADLHRGQALQTQANVRRIDGKRTDVVTVTGNVKRRPDLAVGAIDAPAKVRVGSRINVMATIVEKNGDIGAKGNCKLFLDGTQVDEIRDMFVDAAGTSACAFAPTLDSAGSHTLKVVVDGVVPGDWDTANNENSVTVEVINPSAPFYWWAGSFTRDWSYLNRWEWFYPGATVGSGSESAQSGKEQYSYLNGWSPSRVRFPLARLEASHAVDGANYFSVAENDVAADYEWGNGYYNQSHVTRWDPTQSAYVQVYSYNQGEDYAYSYVYTWRQAYEYVYYGRSYEATWLGYSGDRTYGYTYSGSYQYGTVVSGNDFALAVRVVDGAGTTLEASTTVATEPFTGGYDYPYYCQDYSSYNGYRYCYEYHYKETDRRGWTSGVTGQ